jgi:hypothetical protein
VKRRSKGHVRRWHFLVDSWCWAYFASRYSKEPMVYGKNIRELSRNVSFFDRLPVLKDVV